MTLRNNIIELITTTSSSSAQREYESKVLIASVPAELICGWFDDLYHPETELFSSSFSQSELDALARFHEFYALRVDQIPPEGGVDALQASDAWIEVQNRARSTVEALGW